MQTFTGSIAYDARFNELQEGSVINFTMTTKRVMYSKKYGQSIRESFVDCTIWNADKNDLQHLLRGQILEVVGNISAKAYTNKKQEQVCKIHVDIVSLVFHYSRAN